MRNQPQIPNTELKRILLAELPPLLAETREPPESLYVRGTLPLQESIFLTVVGSRKCTSYGKTVCEMLIHGLRGRPVVIVSGLAIGIDATAHRAAIGAGLTTVAVPGSGLDWDVLYPRQHVNLARDIIQSGGALISEYEPDFNATTWSFPKRNQLMAGMANAVLIIEAEEKSGTLVTARLAMEENRDVLAVPGPITSPSSQGTNILIRDGAIPINGTADLLLALGFSEDAQPHESKMPDDLLPAEVLLWDTLREPMSRDTLLAVLDMNPVTLNITIVTLEVRGLVRVENGQIMRAR